MVHVQDLQLQEHILPIFDVTHNAFAKDQLITLLLTPLTSKAEILERQQILSAFQSQKKIFKHYGYSTVDLKEAYRFSAAPGQIHFKEFPRQLYMQLLFSRQLRERLAARLAQMILLLHRLCSLYLYKIQVESFPASYQSEFTGMLQYVGSLDLAKHEKAIRQGKLKISEIISLLTTLKTHEISGTTDLFWTRFFRFEAFLSISVTTDARPFTFPVFHDGQVELKDFYHPALQKPVCNSFSAQHPVVLITGPNMSGKSTLLKAISIIVYLAHIGFPVPASSCRLPFYQHFIIALQHHDDLRNGYSHFLSDVKVLKQLVIEVLYGHACFAVFDELFTGTTVEDALEIMRTTVKGLMAKHGSFFVLATHLHDLRLMPEIERGDADTYFLQCSLVGQLPQFTYRLEKGWSDLKIGRILFNQEGLNELLKS